MSKQCTVASDPVYNSWKAQYNSNGKLGLDTEEALAPETVLDPIETPEPGSPDLYDDFLAGRQIEQTFRHSFWQTARRNTLLALDVAFTNQRRLSRFRSCGTHAYVQRSTAHPDKYRVTCNRCRDRWCEACQQDYRRKIARNLIDRLPKGRIRFMTLTLKHNREPLRVQLARIVESFKRLRRDARIKKLISGGIAFLELGYNQQTRLWHVHLHAIFQGSYVPHKLLSLVWHEVTGDSYIVDVRDIKNPRVAAGYVTKYASKLIPNFVRNDFELLVQVMMETEHIRTLIAFGSWRSLKLSHSEPSDESWETLYPLASLVFAARAGNVAAAIVLERIHYPESRIESAMLIEPPSEP